MNTPELQALVDEHARVGLDNQAIRQHLRKDHSLDASVVIPPPTSSAQKARTNLPEGLVITARLTKERCAELGEDPQEHYHVPPNPRITGGDKDAITHTPDAICDFFRSVYVGFGQTQFDRWIHGVGEHLMPSNPTGQTHFESVRDASHFQMSDVKQNRSCYEIIAADSEDPLSAISQMQLAWFDNRTKTVNIQINTDLAEQYMATPLCPAHAWKEKLCAQPFYVDIKAAKLGERVVSSVYTRPIKDGTSFEYMAVLEWAGQGCEALVFGEYGNEVQIVRRVDEEDMPPEAVEATRLLYLPLHDQIMRILSMSRMHFDRVHSAATMADFIDHRSSSSASFVRTINAKKSKTKARTHSYFKVLKLTLPRDAQRIAVKGHNSWSLDHLITVSGHFRWQPHGKGLSQYKLIWINNYDKGTGGRHRPEINPELVAV